MSKAILVLGATGKQGGAVLKALLAHRDFSSDVHTIYAVTRSPASASAQRLSALSSSVKLIRGDLNAPAAVFAALPTKPWAVFAMSYPGKTEQADGISTVDAAVLAGVSHIVFSSVDRGTGSPPTEVPHFITKHNIEQHLQKSSETSDGKLTYTIIRPPYFLDNLEPGFLGRVFATLWRDKVKGPLTVVDTADIGAFGGDAILQSSSPTYRNTAINIAGDKLTFEAANGIFRSKTGHDIPTTYSFFVTLLLLLSHDVSKMTEFFNKPGFAADVEESNKMHEMTSFAKWVDRSKHVTQKS